MLRTIAIALSLALLAARPAAAIDWMLAPSTYTHDSQTGQRVHQYSEPGPVYVYQAPDFRRSAFQHNTSINRGPFGSDRLHVVEEWGRPVRPYGEWLFPYRPFSVPYDLWGPPYGGFPGSFRGFPLPPGGFSRGFPGDGLIPGRPARGFPPGFDPRFGPGNFPALRQPAPPVPPGAFPPGYGNAPVYPHQGGIPPGGNLQGQPAAPTTSPNFGPYPDYQSHPASPYPPALPGSHRRDGASGPIQQGAT